LVHSRLVGIYNVRSKGQAMKACRCTLLILSLTVALNAQPRSAKPGENGILNIYDAFGYQKKGTVLDWGFSVLIDYNGKKILFDAGNNAEKFAHNAKALNVDLKKVDIAVLSHRHNDHASGFDYVLEVKPQVKAYLPADPALGAPFQLRFSKEPKEQTADLAPEQLYFGGKSQSLHYKPGSRFDHASAEYISASKQIAPGVHVIFTRSEMMGDFSAYPPAEPGHPDLYGLPEISLALETSKGLVLITGCSHSKVEEIVKAAKNQLNQKVEMVVGGFHLFPYDLKYVSGIARQLKEELGVHRVAPAHCTGNLAFKVFRDLYQHDYSYAGVEAEVKFAP
jgi:7,8-dihydropterin-6-yl-methyl-4-(beta-D-ribofuranosyl)aminobenzene 5'-phosphate synthase